MEFEARMPTLKEWRRLVEITGGDNAKIDWEKMCSWCEDADENYPARRAACGYKPHNKVCYKAESRFESIGFRPVFVPLDPDSAENGAVLPITTLYLNGRPTRVPTIPVYGGDIPKFQIGSRFEFGDMLDIPAFQIQAIKVDGVYIADRNILCDISWDEVKAQGF